MRIKNKRNVKSNIKKKAIMRNMKLSAIILLLASATSLFAQPADEGHATFLSPNAASLGLFTDIPVSQYTGVPNVNIPLHVIKTGDFSMPISLSYHSGNLKPDIHPGWTGLGWTLNAGGAISRKVNGFPDDRSWYVQSYHSGEHYWADLGYYYIENAENIYEDNSDRILGHPEFVEFTDFMNGGNEITYDGIWHWYQDYQPDEFSFNVNGYSAKFYFMGDVIKVSDPTIKVELYSTMEQEQAIPVPCGAGRLSAMNNNMEVEQSRHFAGFRVTTPDGAIYEFGRNWDTHEQAIEKSEPTTPNDYRFITYDTWYLARAISPDKSDTILFKYDYGDNWSGLPSSIQLAVNRSVGLHHYVSCTEHTDASFEHTGNGWCDNNAILSSSISGKFIYPCYLEEISTQHQKITFSKAESEELSYDFPYIYSQVDKCNGCTAIGISENLFDWYKLNQVTIKKIINETETHFKTFNFTYNDDPNKRLLLQKVTEVGKPAYEFYYHPTAAVPYLSMKTDHWGYYAGDILPLQFFFDVSDGQGQSYQPHEYNSLFYNRSGCFDENFPVDYFKDDTLLAQITDAMELHPTTKENPAELFHNLEKIVYPTGGYTTFTYENHSSDYVQARTEEGSVVLIEKDIGGGYRIKEIAFYDNIATLVKNIKYTYEMGIGVGTPSYSFFEVDELLNTTGVWTADWLNDQLLCKTIGSNLDICASSGDYYSNQSYVSSRFSTEAVNPVSSNGAGSITGYSKVTEELIDLLDQAGNGKTVYYFRNFQDHPDLYTTQQIEDGIDLHLDGNLYSVSGPSWDALTPYSLRANDRGQLLAKYVYNSDGNIQLKERNYYQDNHVAIRSYSFTRHDFRNIQGWYCNDGVSNCNNPIYGYTFFKGGAIYWTQIYSPFLTSKEITTFDKNGLNPLIQTTNFEYNLKHQVSTKSILNSDGDLLIQRYKYPGDFPGATGVVGDMNTNNMYNYVLEEQSLINKSGTDNFLSGVITEYGVYNGQIKPSKKLTSKLDAPSTITQQVTVAGDGTITGNEHYSPEVIFDNYNQAGNIQQFHKEEGKTTSYIWSYDNTFPVAKVENAESEEITYTSFENNEVDNWNIGTAVINNTAGATGNAYLESSGTTTISNSYVSTQSGENYIVSFYAKNYQGVSGFVSFNGPIVDGTSPANLTDNWEYYYFIVTQYPALTLNSAEIDEIRFYPVDATMSTYTYDPLLGMTSQTDPNSKILYYDYDCAGRLHQIKDNDYNIIQKNEYHYAGEPTNLSLEYHYSRLSEDGTQANIFLAINNNNCTPQNAIFTVDFGGTIQNINEPFIGKEGKLLTISFPVTSQQIDDGVNYSVSGDISATGTFTVPSSHDCNNLTVPGLIQHLNDFNFSCDITEYGTNPDPKDINYTVCYWEWGGYVRKICIDGAFTSNGIHGVPQAFTSPNHQITSGDIWPLKREVTINVEGCDPVDIPLAFIPCEVVQKLPLPETMLDANVIDIYMPTENHEFFFNFQETYGYEEDIDLTVNEIDINEDTDGDGISNYVENGGILEISDGYPYPEFTIGFINGATIDTDPQSCNYNCREQRLVFSDPANPNIFRTFIIHVTIPVP